MNIKQDLPYYSISSQETINKLQSNKEGLSQEEYKKRFKEIGPNTLPSKDKTNPLFLFLKQFKDLLVVILAIAAIIAYFAGHMVDVCVIVGVIILNALIGFFQEYKAERAIHSLKKLVKHKALVLRNGKRRVVQSKNLVPGDIIILEEGNSIPADARLLEQKNLQVVESSLTGESMPVQKSDEILDKKTNLADRKNMLYKGTHIARGACKAIVTATALNTELGKIAESLKEVKKEKSNFKKKTEDLAKIMAGIAIFTATVVFVLGYFVNEYKLEEISLVTIATLVSSIPEGLPAVLSIVLAIGANRMAKKNAIIRDFTATEMSGSLSVILTDKTGTITRGILTVKNLFLSDENEYSAGGDAYELQGEIKKGDDAASIDNNKILEKTALISAFCNNANIEEAKKDKEPKVSGDPTEAALLVLSKKIFQGHQEKYEKMEIVDDLPFDSEKKYRATLVKTNEDTKEIYVVGAPEKILDLSTHIFKGNTSEEFSDPGKETYFHKIDYYTNNAMRVVACAHKKVDDDTGEVSEEDINDLSFTGLFGIIDPPRDEIKEAVDKCKSAGIRVVMVTGDHKQTALAIAKQVGITAQNNEGNGLPEVLTDDELDVEEEKFNKYMKAVDVFARVSPQTKLRIAQHIQENELMLGMTGDGVNDAPALKSADVGIAMGKRGTDVAKDVSQVVLSDDNFASIVDAIQEGRIVFKNVRQTSFFLITTNFASTSTLIAAIAMGMPYPLLATQILWINLVTDGIMDISLATEPGDKKIMEQKPIKKKEPILNKQILPYLLIIVPVMVILAIFTFKHYLPQSVEKARTGAFLVVAMTQVFNALNMRSLGRSVFSIGFLSNKWLNLAFIGSFVLQFIAIKLPFMQQIFHFRDLAWLDIIIITLLSSSVFIFGEMYKFIKNKMIH